MRQDKINFVLDMDNTYLFVDLPSIQEAIARQYSGAPGNTIASNIIKAAMRFGLISSAVVYGDDQNDPQWIRAGIEQSSIDPRDFNIDVLDRCLLQGRHPEVVVVMSNHPSRKELLRKLKRFCHLVVLVGIPSIPDDIKRVANYFVPLHEVIQVEQTAPQDPDGAMRTFVKEVAKAEARLEFVGVGHMVNKLLPNAGISTPMGKSLIGEAEAAGIIELYDNDNISDDPDAQKVRSCRLIRDNGFVKDVLAESGLDEWVDDKDDDDDAG